MTQELIERLEPCGDRLVVKVRDALIEAAITGGGSYRRDIEYLTGNPVRLARAAIEACGVQSQSARIAELREAMKPFAIYADIQDDHRRSDDEGFCSTTVHGSTGKTTRITCGDLRRLRNALTKDSTSVTG